MANWYVRSGATGGTGAGTSWANAALTVAAAITLSAAGDDIYVSEDHSETTATTLTWTFKGTIASPNRVICVNHGGSVPPVEADLATTGAAACTGAAIWQVNGYVYIYGLKMTFGTSTGNCNFRTQANSANGECILDSCALVYGSTGTGGGVVTGFATASVAQRNIWINTTVQFAAAGQSLFPELGQLIWKNTPNAIAGATFPTTLFNVATAPTAGSILCDGVDLSALGSGKTLIPVAPSPGFADFINCKLGASVTVAAAPTTRAGFKTRVQNCDSGATTYRDEIYDYPGTLKIETTIIRTGGASDGTTGKSWKMVTTANSKVYDPLDSFVIGEWNDVTGSAKTASIEIVNDGTTLTTADIWMELEYLGSSGSPLASMVSSGPANPLDAGSSITTSSATWTTTGLTTPIKQTLSVSFTAGLKGPVRATVRMAKVSKTIYVDPLLTIV